MEANSLPADPYPQPHPLTLGLGSTGQTSTYSEHGHVTYQIKGNHQMQQHGSKYFAPQTPPPHLGMGSVGQNSTFTEHNHVAYQIKENHDCSNIVANILPADPLPPPPLRRPCG